MRAPASGWSADDVPEAASAGVAPIGDNKVTRLHGEAGEVLATTFVGELDDLEARLRGIVADVQPLQDRHV